jgi:hypothetical protein
MQWAKISNSHSVRALRMILCQARLHDLCLRLSKTDMLARTSVHILASGARTFVSIFVHILAVSRFRLAPALVPARTFVSIFVHICPDFGSVHTCPYFDQAVIYTAQAVPDHSSFLLSLSPLLSLLYLVWYGRCASGSMGITFSQKQSKLLADCLAKMYPFPI